MSVAPPSDVLAGRESPPSAPPSPKRKPRRATAEGSQSGYRFGPISLREAPGWLVSLGVHTLVLVALMAFKFHTERQQETSIMSSLEDIESEVNFENTVVDQVGSGSDVSSVAALVGGGGGGGAFTAEAVQHDVQQKVDAEFKSLDGPVTDDALLPGDAVLTENFQTTGGSVENVAQGGGGVEGAIDRLTSEIQQSLRERKTTVIWLFDQSLSLRDRRNAIADRFENVYRQLESIEKSGDGALTTVVATYGEKFTLLTDKPVDDTKPLIEKVRKIPNDPSGKENVFSAVHTLGTKFRTERTAKRRNVMIFIVTDEKGDDADKYLEETIKLCRLAGIRVYTVGNAALFGREKGYVNWKYEDGTNEDLEVDAGPETVEPESLAMGFWGNRGPDLTRMSSGYGPYALTRLCKETGGLFFIAQEDNKGPKFAAATMRSYSPDYRPIRDYQKSLERNKAKGALVFSAKQTKIENIPLPQLGFAAFNDIVLKEGLTEAQKPAAELIYKIERVVEVLSQGEKDRDKVSELRWRAAYDLAIGRALAMKVRSLGYNEMLAEMKRTPKTFAKKDSNEWRITPAKTINAGQAVKKLEKQAATYLKRVVDEHPDTPWALLAAHELAIPMGWEWQEGHNPAFLPANTSPEEARRRIQLAEDERREQAKKKPAAPMPQKERPKL